MKFIQNKYTTWYNNIINNAKDRPVKGYTENHHIIPKCLGGTDDKSNLVRLTGKEHFICHLLLTKMTKGVGRHKLIHAAWAMTVYKGEMHERYKVTSTLYEALKIKNAKIYRDKQTGKVGRNKGHKHMTPEWKEKLRQANLGKKRSKESIEKQRKTMTGKKRPAGVGKAISAGQKGRSNHWLKGKKLSEETRAKMSAARTKYHADKKKINNS
jgi:hypothetical protein